MLWHSRVAVAVALCFCSSVHGSTVLNELKDSSGTGPKYAVQLLTGALPPSQPAADAASVVMTKANGKKYRCRLPRADTHSASADAAAQPSAPSVSSFLGTLKGTCFYRLEGWWTYEFCYMKHVRQFHQEKVKGSLPEKTVVTQDYTLGAWPVPPAGDAGPPTTATAAAAAGGAKVAAAAAAAAADARGDELKEDAKTRKKYWSQRYGNGTMCEVNGVPTGTARETEVRLQCSPGEPSYLASIEEVATCKYLVHFSTNLLCKHPGFAADESKDATQTVQCEPLGPDGQPLPAKPKRRAAAADEDGEGAAAAGTKGTAPPRPGWAKDTSAATAKRSTGAGAGAAGSGLVLPPQPPLQLGQCLIHLKFNYRGVVVGRDPACKMSESWIRANGIDSLRHGRKQPFYYVLTDIRDRPGAPVNYVAHELVMVDTPPEPLMHPLTSDYFTTFDQPTGRFLPTPALLERYPAAAPALATGTPEADESDSA